MPTLVFTGTASQKCYRDFELIVGDGESCKVSDEKAKQLLADYPDNFSEGASKSAKPDKDKALRPDKDK